jgi:N-acetylglutamate synthase-like GNAT family acetyltransferase
LRDADLPTEGVVEQFGHFFVVRDAGLLVGLCGLEVHGEDGLLRSLVVAPTYRGEGLAGLLVHAVLGLARKMELRAVYLLTTTARDYFDRLGFTPCARDTAPAAIRESWEFKAGCPVSSALLHKAVAAEPS